MKFRYIIEITPCEEGNHNRFIEGEHYLAMDEHISHDEMVDTMRAIIKERYAPVQYMLEALDEGWMDAEEALEKINH